MKSFTKIVESMLTRPAMPTWESTPAPTPTAGRLPVGPTSVWGWGK